MHLATAYAVKKPTQLSIFASSLYLALFFVAAAVLQLFAFETYPAVVANYNLPLIGEFDLVLAAVIVCLEVFALPYLLWMKVSRLMRVVSLVAGWTVLIYWFGVGIWQSVADFTIANAGLFGAKVLLPQGWWLVSYCAVLIILMAYVTWAQSIAKARL